MAETVGDIGIDGKTVPKAAAPRVKSIQTFKCPACGGDIKLRVAGTTLTAVCGYCSSVIDTSDENLKIIQRANSQTKRTLLEIGMRGQLAGITWEVIGYTLKSDRTGIYFWDEYLLFNPYYGFRFLVQMDGHWSYVKMLKTTFSKPGFNCQLWYKLSLFKPFLADQPIVQYVKGEFYWRVKKGDKSNTEDYVSPPHMLSFEYNDGDTVVSLCDYIEPHLVATAFGIVEGMPERKGVAPNQPNPVKLLPLMMTAGVAFVLATFIHMYAEASAASKELLTLSETHVPGDQTLTFTSPPFEIPKQSNILVQSYSPVDNQWTELNMSLENDSSGQNFDMRQPIEYYHGYDSDGSWSEGGQWASDYFSGVPAGTYRLVYDMDSGAFPMGAPMDMSVKLTNDVPSSGNYWITLLLLLVWPALAWMRRGAIETKRWSNSDFAPGDDE